MAVTSFDHLSLFKDLEPAQKAGVQHIFHPCRYEPDTILFEQGDRAEYLFVVVEGEIGLHYKPDDGPEIVLARLRPEGVVGWSAVLGSPAYTSTAVCISRCVLLQVSGRDLRLLCESNPKTASIILDRLAGSIAERLRNTHPDVVALLERGLRSNLKIDKSIPVEIDKSIPVKIEGG